MFHLTILSIFAAAVGCDDPQEFRSAEGDVVDVIEYDMNLPGFVDGNGAPLFDVTRAKVDTRYLAPDGFEITLDSIGGGGEDAILDIQAIGLGTVRCECNDENGVGSSQSCSGQSISCSQCCLSLGLHGEKIVDLPPYQGEPEPW